MADPNVSLMRRHPTRAEQLLWNVLRKKRVDDRRFRRQYPLAPYIVDFVCVSARLIVEVDGPSHELTIARDERRTRWLESQGFRVIRFWNDDVLRNLKGVVRAIELALSTPEPADPSP